MALDPFAALSVAAAVVQFVDFSTKLLSKGRELYKSTDGVLADHAEQAAVSSRLAEVSRGLSNSMPMSTTGKRLSPAEQALREVVQECLQSAGDLTDAITQLRVTGKHRKWKSFRQALKSVWRREEIEERLVKLDRHRQQVVIHLLVIMNDGQSKAFAKIDKDMNLMEGKVLDAMRHYDHDMQQQVKHLSRDMSRLAIEQSKQKKGDEEKQEARQSMVDDWQVQNGATLKCMLEKVDQMESDQKALSFQRKLLNSLYFEKIDERENMIDHRYETTLEWVFAFSSNDQGRWSSVPMWLQNSSGLFWVSGKAGSGKSTLMKWLFHEDRTKALLESWAGDKNLLITKYFFWNPGTGIQKSLQGLLRSFLYDSLQQCPDLIPQISPTRWRSYDLELAHFPAWTDADLLIAIRTFIQHTFQTTHMPFH